MNILIDVVPTSVNIEGEDYEMNSDFRTSILFELLMQDGEISEEEKVVQALKLYYPNIPINIQEAINKILWFYRCGKDISYESSGGKGKSNQIYSFDYDDEYIYSAFLDQYGVDLQDIEHLHWWKFKAMFKSLKEDTQIVKIMGYRSMTISKDMSKEEKRFYKDMKKIYSIPKNKGEKEKVNDIENALLNGGDLTKIL